MCPDPYESWMSEPELDAPDAQPRAPSVVERGPSKSWLLALDDRQLDRGGWKPIVPEAPAPRCVRMPSARNSEFQGRSYSLGRWAKPLYWTVGIVAGLGVLLAGWQILRAHASVKPVPRPAVPAPHLQPGAPEVELETGMLQRTNVQAAMQDSVAWIAQAPGAPSDVEERQRSSAALWRQLTLANELERRMQELARVDGPLFDAFPRVSAARPTARSARAEVVVGVAIEAAAPRVRIVGRSHVSGVWEGATVPLDALDRPSQWLTPSVGRVRAELVDGGAVEGRLHAIGDGKLWIEGELGRVALLGSQVRALRQLMPLAGPESGSEIPGLPEVRVRTPGGVFQGRLVAREGGRVTLLTSEGGRVTLDDAQTEPALPTPPTRRP